jgi:hypothetical protein
MEGPVKLAIACCLCAVTAACAVSREGWGRGRFLVIVESTSLQVRRSTIRIDEAAGDVVMNWIGARTPTGEPLLAEFSLTLFEDVNGDHVPQSNEVSSHRSSTEQSEKIILSDVRVPAARASGAWTVLVSARTAGGSSASNVFPFRADD